MVPMASPMVPQVPMIPWVQPAVAAPPAVETPAPPAPQEVTVRIALPEPPVAEVAAPPPAEEVAPPPPPASMKAPAEEKPEEKAVAPCEEKAPAEPAPPEAGDLFRRVNEKIDGERKTISAVSEELLEVGGDVAKTEQTLVGKMLDVETARSLVSKHKEIDAANARAHADFANLRHQIDSLSTLLAKSQHAYQEMGIAQRQAEMRLESKLALQIQQLKDESNRIKGLKLLQGKLSTTRKQLVNKGMHTVAKGLGAKHEIQELLKAIQVEAADEFRLKRSLVEVHNYSVLCHNQAEKLTHDIGAAVALAPKQSVAAAAAERQGEATQKAATERLQAEGVLLRAQIHQTENEGAMAMVSLKQSRLALSELEQSIISEVVTISGKMNISKERQVLLEKSVQDNVGKMDEDNGRKIGLENEIAELHKQVNPIVFAALDAENAALKVEIVEATSLLAKSKETEAQGFASLSQLQAEEEAARTAVDVAHAAVNSAQAQGQAQLQDAVGKAQESEVKAKDLETKAHAVVNERCAPKWDERETQTGDEVAECRGVGEELTIVKAQKETLEQTLKAQQSAEAPVE
jgi:hypothetical protein